MNPRNFLVLIALFIVLIVGFVVIGNLLNALVPLIVTAIIAFILGRLSVRFNLLDAVRSIRLPRPAAKPAAAPKAAETPVAKAAVPPADAAIPQKAINPDLLLDPNFEIKTSDQIEAEARAREQEALKRAASTDVNAALEERRKRLLGNKGDGG
jgi:hypothetical protein